MKRIIYTAVALIICASVFGIADYLNAKKHGALADYTEEVQTPIAVTPRKKTEITPAAKELPPTVATKKENEKKNVMASKISKTKNKPASYTADIPNIAVTDKTKEPVFEKIDPMTILLSNTTLETVDSTIQQDNKRKISMEMFSRAPIRIKKKRN